MTIYEAEEELGGLLRYAVPEFKVPNKVLDYEIATILKMGIEVKCNHRLGQEVSMDELNSQFDAVLLTIGAGVDQPLGLPGSDLAGVQPALDFLRKYNAGGEVKQGKSAAVIGGNNVAMETARALLRQGYEVTIVNPKKDTSGLGANPVAIKEAEKEGARFLFQVEPVRSGNWVPGWNWLWTSWNWANRIRKASKSCNLFLTPLMSCWWIQLFILRARWFARVMRLQRLMCPYSEKPDQGQCQDRYDQQG